MLLVYIKRVNKTCLVNKIKGVHPLPLDHRIRAGVEIGRSLYRNYCNGVCYSLL